MDDPMERLREVEAVHQRKVRSLMSSINALRQENAKLVSATKDHHRSQYLQKVQRRLRQAELVADVLKAKLGEAAGMDTEEIQRFVVAKTVGGPKRFRPKTREELVLELQNLEREHKKVVSTQKRLKGAQARAASYGDRPRGGEDSEETKTSTKPVVGPEIHAAFDAVAYGQRTQRLQIQIDDLKAELKGKDVALEEQAKEMDDLHQELQQLQLVSSKVTRTSAKHSKAKEQLLGLQSEKLALTTERDEANATTRRLERENLFLQDELDRTQEQAAMAAKRASDAAADLQGEIETLQEQIEAHRGEATAARAAASEDRKSQSEVEKEMSVLRRVRSGLEEEVQKLARELESVTRERDESGVQLEQAVTRVTTLEKEVDAAHAQYEEAVSKQTALQTELDQLHRAVDAAGETDKGRITKLEELEAAVDSAKAKEEAAKEESRGHQETIAALEEEIKTAEQRMKAGKILSKKLEVKVAQLQAAASAPSQLQEDVEAGQHLIHELQTQNQQLHADLEAMHEELEVARQHGATEVPAPVQALAEADTTAEVTELKQQLAEALVDHQDFEAALQSAAEGLLLFRNHIQVLEQYAGPSAPPMPQLPEDASGLLEIVARPPGEEEAEAGAGGGGVPAGTQETVAIEEGAVAGGSLPVVAEHPEAEVYGFEPAEPHLVETHESVVGEPPSSDEVQPTTLSVSGTPGLPSSGSVAAVTGSASETPDPYMDDEDQARLPQLRGDDDGESEDEDGLSDDADDLMGRSPPTGTTPTSVGETPEEAPPDLLPSPEPFPGMV